MAGWRGFWGSWLVAISLCNRTLSFHWRKQRAQCLEDAEKVGWKFPLFLWSLFLRHASLPYYSASMGWFRVERLFCPAQVQESKVSWESEMVFRRSQSSRGSVPMKGCDPGRELAPGMFGFSSMKQDQMEHLWSVCWWFSETWGRPHSAQGRVDPEMGRVCAVYLPSQSGQIT